MKKPMNRQNRNGMNKQMDKKNFKIRRKRVCRFCTSNDIYIDFKNEKRLIRFLTEQGKIIPRRMARNFLLSNLRSGSRFSEISIRILLKEHAERSKSDPAKVTQSVTR